MVEVGEDRESQSFKGSYSVASSERKGALPRLLRGWRWVVTVVFATFE